MYTSIIFYKKEWGNDEEVVITNFKTKEEAAKFNWEQLTSKKRNHVCFRTQVCKQGISLQKKISYI